MFGAGLKLRLEISLRLCLIKLSLKLTGIFLSVSPSLPRDSKNDFHTLRLLYAKLEGSFQCQGVLYEHLQERTNRDPSGSVATTKFEKKKCYSSSCIK
jgi:hypothetical protein